MLKSEKDQSTNLETANSGKLFENSNSKWMTTKEAAFHLRVSVGQLRNMVYRDQVKCYRLNNRLRFLRSDLDKLLKPSHYKEVHQWL